MVSVQPACPNVAGAAEPPSHNEIKNAEQHLENLPKSRTIQWEELPKATTQKMYADRTIQWEEPKRTIEVKTDEEMDMTTEMVSIVPSSPGAAIMLEINNEMKTTTEAGREYCATVKQLNECLLDSTSTWCKASMDNEIITTEWALHLKGQMDLEEQMVNVRSFQPSAECVPYYVKPETEYRQSTFLETCPVMTNITGHSSIQKADNKDWDTTYQPIWDKQIKKEFVLPLENNKMSQCMKGNVSLTQSSPRKSHIFGIPSVLKAGMTNVDMTNMVSLSTSCSKVSQILGFPSSHNLKEWTLSKEPLFQRRMKEKQVSINDKCEMDKQAMKAMVSLVPSCLKEAWTPGFPSHQHPITMYCAPDITRLFTLCSQVSKIPGFSSVDGDMNGGWVTKEGSLLKRLPKKGVIFDRSNDNNVIMKNMVSCVPSCPKVSSIHGFPSIPNPQIAYYSLNVFHLLPLCPLNSVIPGFSSIEGHMKKDIFVELGSFMNRPEKNMKFWINGSPVNIDKPSNMLGLFPSCPGASRIPGFPSVPRYSMLNLVPVCPKVSSFPGFASFEGASRYQWIFVPHFLCYKLPKENCFVICSRNQGETAKSMLAIAPSCPKASRIHGFPSASQTKSKIESTMISFLPCCSSTSSLKGFASNTTIPCTGWLSGTKPLFIKPQKKRGEMIMTLDRQHWQYRCSRKCMVTIVTSCPKEARVHGFPSAQAVNRPLNMVSFHTSLPCVSRVPGFPSARTLSFECMKIKPRSTLSKPLFEHLRNENVFVSATFSEKHKPKQYEMNYMVATAPICPHLTQIPGLPSISQFNPIEKQRIPSQELSNAKSTTLYLKDTRIPGVPSTSVSNPSTELAYGETFVMIS